MGLSQIPALIRTYAFHNDAWAVEFGNCRLTLQMHSEFWHVWSIGRPLDALTVQFFTFLGVCDVHDLLAIRIRNLFMLLAVLLLLYLLLRRFGYSDLTGAASIMLVASIPTVLLPIIQVSNTTWILALGMGLISCHIYWSQLSSTTSIPISTRSLLKHSGFWISVLTLSIATLLYTPVFMLALVLYVGILGPAFTGSNRKSLLWSVCALVSLSFLASTIFGRSSLRFVPSGQWLQLAYQESLAGLAAIEDLLQATPYFIRSSLLIHDALWHGPIFLGFALSLLALINLRNRLSLFASNFPLFSQGLSS